MKETMREVQETQENITLTEEQLEKVNGGGAGGAIIPKDDYYEPNPGEKEKEEKVLGRGFKTFEIL